MKTQYTLFSFSNGSYQYWCLLPGKADSISSVSTVNTEVKSIEFPTWPKSLATVDKKCSLSIVSVSN